MTMNITTMININMKKNIHMMINIKWVAMNINKDQSQILKLWKNTLTHSKNAHKSLSSTQKILLTLVNNAKTSLSRTLASSKVFGVLKSNHP